MTEKTFNNVCKMVSDEFRNGLIMKFYERDGYHHLSCRMELEDGLETYFQAKVEVESSAIIDIVAFRHNVGGRIRLFRVPEWDSIHIALREVDGEQFYVVITKGVK